MSKPFWVADLDATGEVRLKEEYDYELLQRIDLAALMIAEFATYLWREPDGFDVEVPAARHMTLRWRPSADTAGIATLRSHGKLASVSLLATGKNRQSDTITFQAFQTHLVRELHDTGYEPAFDLVAIPERPLVASVHFEQPENASDRVSFAIADRCFAAAYFRYQGIA